MDHRFVLLAVLGLGCASAAAVACSAPDPGEITFAERVGTPSTPGGSSGNGSSSGGDGGATDGGGSSSSGGSDPVFGDTAFAYQNPGVTANGASMSHAGTVVGKNCAMAQSCHAPGSPGPTWLIGGTVFDGPASTTTIAQAEIRVVDGTGKELAKTYTDPNGNFWFEKGALPDIPNGAKVGVRTAAKVARMATALTAAPSVGCNNDAGCHGPMMRIYVN